MFSYSTYKLKSDEWDSETEEKDSPVAKARSILGRIFIHDQKRKYKPDRWQHHHHHIDQLERRACPYFPESNKGCQSKVILFQDKHIHSSMRRAGEWNLRDSLFTEPEKHVHSQYNEPHRKGNDCIVVQECLVVDLLEDYHQDKKVVDTPHREPERPMPKSCCIPRDGSRKGDTKIREMIHRERRQKNR